MRKFLEPHPQLDIDEAVLQLHVHHKGGTGHAYLVHYKVTDGLNLGKHLDVLSKLLDANAHNGVLEVDGAKYYAIEISDLAAPSLKMISNDMPHLELPPDPFTESAADVQPEELSLKEANQMLEKLAEEEASDPQDQIMAPDIRPEPESHVHVPKKRGRKAKES